MKKNVSLHKINYNYKREERKVSRVEAENRDEGLQGPDFSFEETGNGRWGGGGEKRESRCTGCCYWKTQKRTVRRAISVKHIFFWIYHALVSPKANLIFLLCGNYRLTFEEEDAPATSCRSLA